MQLIHKISVTGRIPLDLPAENALAVVRDLKYIELYEPKVDSACIKPETKKTGSYSLKGRFAGVPWNGKFSYELNNQGFHSEMIQRSWGVSMNGGFVVLSEGLDRCHIVHYENYRFPYWMSPLIRLVRLYLSWAMKKELRELAKIIHEEYKREAKITPSAPISEVVVTVRSKMRAGYPPSFLLVGRDTSP